MSLDPKQIDERKKKIVVISEIDELKVIANNHYLMGKFDDAIKTAKEIIDMAKTVDLNSIIREQVKFITKIYMEMEKKNQKPFYADNFEDLQNKFKNLLKNERFDEIHEMVIDFKQKYDNIIDLSQIPSIQELIEKEEKIWEEYIIEHNNIKRQLEPLEIQLESYLSTNNINLARETFQKAKPLLNNLKDTNIKNRWETMEAMFIELRKNYDFLKEVENSIEEISKLTDNYEFNKAKNLLSSINQLVKEKGLTDYKKELIIKERAILDAEQKYNKLVKDIEGLENLVEDNIKHYLFNDAIDNCKQIIKISRFIGKTKYVEKYSEYIEDIKSKVQDFDKFEEFRENIISMNNEALNALFKEDFILTLNKFKVIREKLKHLINLK